MQTEINNYESTKNSDTHKIKDSTDSDEQERAAADLEEQQLATFGMFINHYDAERAVVRLEKNGFLRDQISILAPQASGRRDFVYQQRTSLKDGAMIGAVIGFFVLGFLGFVLSLGTFTQFETLTQPSVTGSMPPWILSTAIGATIGLIYGAASGALVGIGTPKGAAKRYGFYLKEGAIMLSVKLNSEAQRVRANEILEKTRAQDISDLKESEIWKTIVPEKKRLAFT